MRSIFFAPHSDDECLFGAFTLLKYQPTVVICFPSSGDYGDTKARYNESVAACLNLGVTDVRQWQEEHPLIVLMREIDEELHPEIVWTPTDYASHPEHVLVFHTAEIQFGDRVRRYDTYSMLTSVGPWKDQKLPMVPMDDPYWVAIKHFALTKYESQIRHPRAGRFFRWPLDEFAEHP